MIYNLYSIRDVHTGFAAPTAELNDYVAMRNFSSAIQQSESVLFTHAGDFSLWGIGQLDTETGVITPLSPLEHIMDGGAVLNDMAK